MLKVEFEMLDYYFCDRISHIHLRLKCAFFSLLPMMTSSFKQQKIVKYSIFTNQKLSFSSFFSLFISPNPLSRLNVVFSSDSSTYNWFGNCKNKNWKFVCVRSIHFISVCIASLWKIFKNHFECQYQRHNSFSFIRNSSNTLNHSDANQFLSFFFSFEFSFILHYFPFFTNVFQNESALLGFSIWSKYVMILHLTLFENYSPLTLVLLLFVFMHDLFRSRIWMEFFISLFYLILIPFKIYFFVKNSCVKKMLRYVFWV